MGTPDARLEDRLREAYSRYAAADRAARPGTAAASRMAKARIDLVIVLDEAGEQLPDDVLRQVARDADELLRTTPPLT
jgi:hypothetical protein